MPIKNKKMKHYYRTKQSEKVQEKKVSNITNFQPFLFFNFILTILYFHTSYN